MRAPYWAGLTLGMLFTLAALGDGPSTPAPAPVAADDAPRRKTVAHDLLEIEKPLGTVTPPMTDLLDSLIESARKQLGVRPAADNLSAQRTYALASLRRIDELLTATNFVYAPHDHMATSLSDALTPRPLSGNLLNQVLWHSGNARRSAQISARRNQNFYLADCDTVSFLYVAIGEALDLPIAMVEVHSHNFVRWYLSDREYYNWETVYARTRTDRDFIRDYRVPQAAIDNGACLSRMTRDHVLGYGRCITAAGLEAKDNHAAAQEQYRLALKVYNKSPLPWNNLAWSLTTCPDPRLRDGKEAVRLATEAVTRYSTANSLDTLACAHAEGGDFDKAVQTAHQAWSRDPANGELLKHYNGFRQKKTWLQLHPRP
jgi:tetratricopeptide (TPR) repeat protein